MKRVVVVFVVILICLSAMMSVTYADYCWVKNKRSNYISVQWSSIDNALGYNIFRKQGNGTWKRIATVTSVYYDDFKVKQGKTYSYQVKAYSGGSYIWESDVDTITCLKPVKVYSVNAENGVITIKWKRNNVADGYGIKVEIYDQKGEFMGHDINNTISKSKTSYVIKKCKTDYSYQIKIWAYKDNSSSYGRSLDITMK